MDRKDRKDGSNPLRPHEGGRSCGRPLGVNEATLDVAGFDLIERAVLEISRYYWQSFAVPASQSWLRALNAADQRFGTTSGGEIGLGILAAVQAMRMSRASCFQFNNPACPECARIVSDHERLYMDVFRAIRGGSFGSAMTHAMILCEGNDTSVLIHRMTDIVRMACGEELAHRNRVVANG